MSFHLTAEVGKAPDAPLMRNLRCRIRRPASVQNYIIVQLNGKAPSLSEGDTCSIQVALEKCGRYARRAPPPNKAQLTLWKDTEICRSPIAVDWSGFVSRQLCSRRFESDLLLHIASYRCSQLVSCFRSSQPISMVGGTPVVVKGEIKLSWYIICK